MMTEKLSLTELQLIIRDTLYISLPQMFWVVAEISEININSSGHCYLELIEKHPDEKNVRSRIKGIIWSSRYGFIKSFFENITGESLAGGLKILVRAKIEYHELYGLSLIISDIDPSFTIGEMALKRQLIIKRLEEEGIFTMNRDINFPVLPQRIAIISSKKAAGYSDFINQLKGNSYGYVFYTALIETPMQGSETEQGVINALDRIAVNYELFDLVVIIRGGGSQSDLSWFDSYNIAYHVTQFPIPVVTGIGHDKDISVTDMVANKSLKTPTAVADYIIDCMATAENQLNEMSSEIVDLARVIIDNNNNIIEKFRIKLFPLTKIMISATKEKLTGKIMAIINVIREQTYKAGVLTSNHSSRLISSSRVLSSGRMKSVERFRQELMSSSLNSLGINKTMVMAGENILNMLNPENVLRRGYTITSMNGRIIKSRTLLKKDDVIDTQFSDGTVRSSVAEVPEESSKNDSVN